MTIEDIAPEEVEEEEEGEEELDFGFVQDQATLQLGETFFVGGVATFAEEHEAKAISVGEDGTIWLFPAAGGKPVSLNDWRAPSATGPVLASVRKLQ